MAETTEKWDANAVEAAKDAGLVLAASDPISATAGDVSRGGGSTAAAKRPETAGAKRAREAQDAFARARGLPVKTRETATTTAKSSTKASAPKSAQKGSATVAKTTTKAKTTEKTSDAKPEPRGKVADVIAAFRSEPETRYAVKVWRFLKGQRSSAPAKTGLSTERASAIYAKVEAAV